MRKTKEKEEAIRLRRENGLSLREISEKLKVSKGTVSVWVRGIELSKEHQERLDKLGNRCFSGKYKTNKIEFETLKRLVDSRYSLRKIALETNRSVCFRNSCNSCILHRSSDTTVRLRVPSALHFIIGISTSLVSLVTIALIFGAIATPNNSITTTMIRYCFIQSHHLWSRVLVQDANQSLSKMVLAIQYSQ